MSGPGVGFQYPPQEVTWLKRDVLLFANSIGCTADELQYLYVSHPWLSRVLEDADLYLPGITPQLCCLPNISCDST